MKNQYVSRMVENRSMAVEQWKQEVRFEKFWNNSWPYRCTAIQQESKTKKETSVSCPRLRIMSCIHTMKQEAWRSVCIDLKQLMSGEPLGNSTRISTVTASCKCLGTLCYHTRQRQAWLWWKIQEIIESPNSKRRHFQRLIRRKIWDIPKIRIDFLAMIRAKDAVVSSLKLAWRSILRRWEK